MIAVACPECKGDTRWRYPHFKWAKEHVPGIPDRCFMYAGKDGLRHVLGHLTCSDPFGHIEKFRKEHDRE